MTSIKKFIDTVALAEARQSRTIVMTVDDAKQLRDEITKVLLDQRENQKEETIQVVMNGGKW